MTDNEIIKALECCSTVTCFTNKCPYEEIYDIPKCTTKLTQDALDLINRQKAEIEKCENIIRLADKTIEKQSAEIERLNKQLVFEIESAYDRGMKAAVKSLKEKAEKYASVDRDFLCTEIDGFETFYSIDEVIEHLGDFVIKEMVGEKDES